MQLRLFRIARRDGLSVKDAARVAGIGHTEADLIDKDDRRNPPTPDCYLLSAGMARRAIGDMADTPLGNAAIARLTGENGN